MKGKTMANEQAQAKAQRLMLLGILSEASQEDRDKVESARQAVLAAIEPFGDLGKLGATLVVLEYAAED